MTVLLLNAVRRLMRIRATASGLSALSISIMSVRRLMRIRATARVAPTFYVGLAGRRDELCTNIMQVHQFRTFVP